MRFEEPKMELIIELLDEVATLSVSNGDQNDDGFYEEGEGF